MEYFECILNEYEINTLHTLAYFKLNQCYSFYIINYSTLLGEIFGKSNCSTGKSEYTFFWWIFYR